ncbi:MAG TPA: 2-hydroxyacid dehydrogenase [Patescibacteria group bacterium]|nr:2-hydroxyacid dehydrogenase [Patescibacteria group bacterium]
MKFKKALVVGIDQSQLDNSTWGAIDELAEKRVMLTADSKDINNELKDADALLVYFNKADREMIDVAPNLKYIGALATGTGKIDSDYAATKNIIVTNVPGYSTESVAELVFGVLLEKLREIARAKSESKEGNRSELGFTGTEIKGKKFGVLGLGRIGARVGELAQAFGADVSYWSQNRKKDVEKNGLKYAEIDEVLSSSDILSIHFALNSNTEDIINEERVNKIKKGAIIVNTAPMELINYDALLKRVKNGELTFIFDHTDLGDITEEKLKALQVCDNCTTYPCIGYISAEARVAKQDIFVENMKSFLSGKPQNTVS